MTEAKITFDRLNDFNWATWRFRMELMLMKEDLWSTVKDSKPMPVDVTSAWTRKDEKAREMIGLKLEDGQLSHVMDAVSANDMWERLKSYHERGSLSNKVHVLRRLCSMRLDEGGNVSNHLMEASELVHRLTNLRESLKEHLVVAILLSSLPESYNSLITALEGRPEGDLKLDYVKGKLLDEWRRKSEIRKQEDERAMKLTVHYEGRRNVVRTCYNCGRAGHLKRNSTEEVNPPKAESLYNKENQIRNSTEWLEEIRRKEKKKHGKEEVLTVQHPDPERDRSRGVCFATTTGSDVLNKESWIIDTGCTQHMTGSVRNFTDRIQWNEKILLAENEKILLPNRKGRCSGYCRKQNRFFVLSDTVGLSRRSWN